MATTDGAIGHASVKLSWYKRSLAISEKALSAEHPNVAQGLENDANLLRTTGRVSEATEMESQAKRVRTKHAGDNK